MLLKGRIFNISGTADGVKLKLSEKVDGYVEINQKALFASRLFKGHICSILRWLKEKLEHSGYVEEDVEQNQKDTICIEVVKRAYTFRVY